MPRIEIIGVYPTEASEPVHLIEFWIRSAEGVFDIGGFTQEIPGQSSNDWQVPFMERILNAVGNEVLADDFEVSRRPDLWRGDMRMAFFFHYVDFERPLRTPFGEVQLPTESEFPERLAMIEYEQP